MGCVSVLSGISQGCVSNPSQGDGELFLLCFPPGDFRAANVLLPPELHGDWPGVLNLRGEAASKPVFLIK